MKKLTMPDRPLLFSKTPTIIAMNSYKILFSIYLATILNVCNLSYFRVWGAAWPELLQ